MRDVKLRLMIGGEDVRGPGVILLHKDGSDRS
jgi:hypothetical protein